MFLTKQKEITILSILDIIVISILAIFAIVGFIKGFLNTLLSLFGNLASLAIAIVVVKPCARFLDKIFGIVKWLGNLIVNGLNGSGIIPDLTSSTMKSDDVISYMSNGRGLLGKFASLFVDKETTYGAGAESDLVATLTKNMGNFAATIFTVIILFILIRIAVFILSKIFDAITKKRALSGLDRLLGFAFGAVKGAVVITCGLTILYTLSPIFPQIDKWITDSNFTQWLYGYVNQLINWLVNTVDWKSLGIIK